MSLEGDIFGDPNAATAEPVKPIADSSGDIFASAVSQPEMKRIVCRSVNKTTYIQYSDILTLFLMNRSL